MYGMSDVPHVSNEIPDLDKINSEYKDKGCCCLRTLRDLGMGISDDEMAQIKDIMSNANASSHTASYGWNLPQMNPFKYYGIPYHLCSWIRWNHPWTRSKVLRTMKAGKLSLTLT